MTPSATIQELESSYATLVAKLSEDLEVRFRQQEDGKATILSSMGAVDSMSSLDSMEINGFNGFLRFYEFH